MVSRMATSGCAHSLLSDGISAALRGSNKIEQLEWSISASLSVWFLRHCRYPLVGTVPSYSALHIISSSKSHHIYACSWSWAWVNVVQNLLPWCLKYMDTMNTCTQGMPLVCSFPTRKWVICTHLRQSFGMAFLSRWTCSIEPEGRTSPSVLISFWNTRPCASLPEWNSQALPGRRETAARERTGHAIKLEIKNEKRLERASLRRPRSFACQGKCKGWGSDWDCVSYTTGQVKDSSRPWTMRLPAAQ